MSKFEMLYLNKLYFNRIKCNMKTSVDVIVVCKENLNYLHDTFLVWYYGFSSSMFYMIYYTNRKNDIYVDP